MVPTAVAGFSTALRPRDQPDVQQGTCATGLVRCLIVQPLAGRVMRGGSLAAYLAARGGRLPEADVQVLAYCILSGLREMHAGGYCHLDVKPAKVGLAEDGNLGTAALMDYGSAEPIGAATTLRSCVRMRIAHAFLLYAPADLIATASASPRGRSIGLD